MRIGQDNNFLSIQLNSLEGGYTICRIDAVAIASGCRFTASHEKLMLEASDDILKKFADFESFESEQIEIKLSEGSWLRFQRDARGYITVCYRISSWKVSSVIEGEIVIDGEFTGSFCRKFGALLRECR